MRWVGRCVLGFGEIKRGDMNAVCFMDEVDDIVGKRTIKLQVVIYDVWVRLSRSDLTDVDVLGTVAGVRF